MKDRIQSETKKKQRGEAKPPAAVDPSSDPEMRTVSSDALLVDGSDSRFRKTVHGLMAIANIMDGLRAGWGRLAGISAPQHELMMLIFRSAADGGISVGDLATKVKLTPSFIATETGKLQAQGLIVKKSDPRDRRRILLTVTEEGSARLIALSRFQRQVNDVMLGCFDHESFLTFSRMLDEVVASGERAVDLLTLLCREHERRHGDLPVGPELAL